MSRAVLSAIGGLVPPPWLRKLEAAAMLAVFARAFDVEPPSLRRRSADESLAAFRLFTAACMEEALADGEVAARYRARLGARALGLGRALRRVPGMRAVAPIEVARFFYRGIGIELCGALPGELRFGPCSFAQRYTPGDCWLMSAFDEGFMRGISGAVDADLVFESRITQGAACCGARFARKAPALQPGR